MKPTPTTRVSIILRLQDPNAAAAWGEFVEIYRPLIYDIAIKKGMQPADAADLTQEAMSRIVLAIERFEPDVTKGSFRGWLSTITRNLIVDFLRRDLRLPSTAKNSDQFQFLQSVPAPAEDTQWFDLQNRRQMFAWAVQKVQPEFRSNTWQAFWKTSVEHSTPAAVANELGISVGAVYIARSRVIARLRTIVQATEFGGSNE